MNPAEWLARAARRAPDAPALLTGEALRADYAGFARRAAAIASALRNRYGVAPEDRVGVFMTNRTEYLEALYGAWWAGATVVPINAKLHPREAAWILEHARAQTVFVSDDVGDPLRAHAPKGLRHLISADAPEFATLHQADPLSAPHPIPAERMAWLFYTSGTTGRPKGVMMSARNLQAMTLSYFADVEPVGPQDAILYAAPMSHGAGIYNFMHILAAAPHVAPEGGGFDPAEILTLAPRIAARLGREDAISMFAAPTMVRRLVDAAKSGPAAATALGPTGAGIKTVVYGGGPMYLADIIDAVDAMGPRFAQIYGQGECPMSITALTRAEVADRTDADWKARLGSVGRAQTIARLRIGDDQGAELPPGDIGEIMVSGDNVMLGYWDDPAATAAALRGGWLWTGDRGALDPDGYLTLHDRSKDMIISGGTNIYPREVEEALLEHAEVAEAAVVGRPHQDWGEEVVAFVTPVPGAHLEPGALDAHCLERIARFKRPKAYVVTDALPKNNYGKVLKTELRKRLKPPIGRT